MSAAESAKTIGDGAAPKPRLAATIRADIIKPVGISWDELGAALRGVQRVQFRVLNRAISDLRIEHDQGRLHGCRCHEKRDDTTSIAGRAYQLVGAAIEAEGAQEQIGSAVQLGVATVLAERFKDWLKNGWTKSLPSWKGTAPIIVTSSGDKFAIMRDTDLAAWVLSVRLAPGRGDPLRLVLAVDRGLERTHVRRLVSGADEAKHGDLRILPPNAKLNRSRWSVRISYTWDAPVPGRGGYVVALHRGIRRMLTLACSDGTVECLADGADVLEVKRRFGARKAGLRKHAALVGSGGRGRGRARRFESYEALQNKEARWVESYCRALAAKAVKRAVALSAHTILIEDWTNPCATEEDPKAFRRLIFRWPFAIERGAIEWAAKKVGLAVRTVEAAYQSQRCPWCATVTSAVPGANGTGEDKRQDVRAQHKFRCSGASCGRTADLDDVAGLNMLAAAGFVGSSLDPEREGHGGVRAPDPAREGASGPEVSGSTGESSPGPVSDAADAGPCSRFDRPSRRGARKGGHKTTQRCATVSGPSEGPIGS